MITRGSVETTPWIDVRQWHRWGYLRSGSSFTLSWSVDGQPCGGVYVRIESSVAVLSYRSKLPTPKVQKLSSNMSGSSARGVISGLRGPGFSARRAIAEPLGFSLEARRASNAGGVGALFLNPNSNRSGSVGWQQHGRFAHDWTEMRTCSTICRRDPRECTTVRTNGCAAGTWWPQHGVVQVNSRRSRQLLNALIGRIRHTSERAGSEGRQNPERTLPRGWPVAARCLGAAGLPRGAAPAIDPSSALLAGPSTAVEAGPRRQAWQSGLPHGMGRLFERGSLYEQSLKLGGPNPWESRTSSWSRQPP